MSVLLPVSFLAVSFVASAVGSICGIGGGVLIKALLDFTGAYDVATVSFLSGCTVLAMSSCTALCNGNGKDNPVDKKTATPLALGAAAGGVAGKSLFSYLSGFFADSGRVGAVQAACLFAVTFGVLLYTLGRQKITTLHVHDPAASLVIGLSLGVCSSFLGIGGGPMNLVVLYFFFSLGTKEAVRISLLIVLFSQTASLLQTFFTGSVPEFPVGILLLMMAGGIFGGVCGRAVNKKISVAAVDRLFLVVTVVVMLICISNFSRFL